jgi:type VI secretion system secreted protein VgrG
MPEQKGRILHFQSPLGDKRCAINALSGYERLNELYSFDITLVADQDPVAPDELLGEDVTITITHADIERKLHGVVCEFTEVDPVGDNVFEYRVVVVPRLWLLGLCSHNRLFEDKDAVDIVKQVVQESCQMAIETANLKTYRKREVCCQFGETDLDFVTRLLAEEGIAYYFKHTKGDCKLVLSGGMDGFQNCSPASYPYNERNTSPWKHRVSRFKQAGRLCTGKLVSTDYGEYAPSSPVDVEAKSKVTPKKMRPGEMAVHGRHDFERSGDGRNLPKGSCTEQTKRWLHGMEADGAEFNGESGAPSFIAGYKYELEDVPVSAGGETQFLLTEVTHSASEGYDQDASYSNSFRCVACSNSMAFTPEPPLDRPRVWGPQTAKVVEVRNPEAPGAHGEVKVQFPWNTQQSSCWARVAQLYAGNKWGGFFIPDIDQEVLVEYVNGDPDRPVVVGAVYNEDNQIPPYTKWQSGIRTRSDEYNELRFDDNPGSEEVYFQAGKDHNFLVQHDESGEIGNDETLKVGNNQEIEIGTDQKIDVGSNVKYEAGQKINIKAGTDIVMEAGMSITLKVGGSEIKIDNTGVTIEGTMINIKGKAMTEVTGSAMLTLKGGLTKIN